MSAETLEKENKNLEMQLARLQAMIAENKARIGDLNEATAAEAGDPVGAACVEIRIDALRQRMAKVIKPATKLAKSWKDTVNAVKELHQKFETPASSIEEAEGRKTILQGFLDGPLKKLPLLITAWVEHLKGHLTPLPQSSSDGLTMQPLEIVLSSVNEKLKAELHNAQRELEESNLQLATKLSQAEALGPNAPVSSLVAALNSLDMEKKEKLAFPEAAKSKEELDHIIAETKPIVESAASQGRADLGNLAVLNAANILRLHHSLHGLIETHICTCPDCDFDPENIPASGVDGATANVI